MGQQQPGQQPGTAMGQQQPGQQPGTAMGQPQQQPQQQPAPGTDEQPDPEMEKLFQSGEIQNLFRRLGKMAKKYPGVAANMTKMGQAAESGYQGRQTAVNNAMNFRKKAPGSGDSRTAVNQVANGNFQALQQNTGLPLGKSS
jgi:hypothetical protein